MVRVSTGHQLTQRLTSGPSVFSEQIMGKEAETVQRTGEEQFETVVWAGHASHAHKPTAAVVIYARLGPSTLHCA